MKKIEKLPRVGKKNLYGKIDELVDAVNEIVEWKDHIPPDAPEVKEEPRNEEINQCDGCRRGTPIKDGVHQGISVWDLQACTKDKYKPTLAERLESVDLDYTKRNNKYYFGALSDEAKKAFEELVKEWKVDDVSYLILIERIRRM